MRRRSKGVDVEAARLALWALAESGCLRIAETVVVEKVGDQWAMLSTGDGDTLKNVVRAAANGDGAEEKTLRATSVDVRERGGSSGGSRSGSGGSRADSNNGFAFRGGVDVDVSALRSALALLEDGDALFLQRRVGLGRFVTATWTASHEDPLTHFQVRNAAEFFEKRTDLDAGESAVEEGPLDNAKKKAVKLDIDANSLAAADVSLLQKLRDACSAISLMLARAGRIADVRLVFEVAADGELHLVWAEGASYETDERDGGAGDFAAADNAASDDTASDDAAAPTAPRGASTPSSPEAASTPTRQKPAACARQGGPDGRRDFEGRRDPDGRRDFSGRAWPGPAPRRRPHSARGPNDAGYASRNAPATRLDEEARRPLLPAAFASPPASTSKPLHASASSPRSPSSPRSAVLTSRSAVLTSRLLHAAASSSPRSPFRPPPWETPRSPRGVQLRGEARSSASLSKRFAATALLYAAPHISPYTSPNRPASPTRNRPASATPRPNRPSSPRRPASATPRRPASAQRASTQRPGSARRSPRSAEGSGEDRRDGVVFHRWRRFVRQCHGAAFSRARAALLRAMRRAPQRSLRARMLVQTAADAFAAATAEAALVDAALADATKALTDATARAFAEATLDTALAKAGDAAAGDFADAKLEAALKAAAVLAAARRDAALRDVAEVHDLVDRTDAAFVESDTADDGAAKAFAEAKLEAALAAAGVLASAGNDAFQDVAALHDLAQTDATFVASDGPARAATTTEALFGEGGGAPTRPEAITCEWSRVRFPQGALDFGECYPGTKAARADDDHGDPVEAATASGAVLPADDWALLALSPAAAAPPPALRAVDHVSRDGDGDVVEGRKGDAKDEPRASAADAPVAAPERDAAAAGDAGDDAVGGDADEAAADDAPKTRTFENPKLEAAPAAAAVLAAAGNDALRDVADLFAKTDAVFFASVARRNARAATTRPKAARTDDNHADHADEAAAAGDDAAGDAAAPLGLETDTATDSVGDGDSLDGLDDDAFLGTEAPKPRERRLSLRLASPVQRRLVPEPLGEGPMRTRRNDANTVFSVAKICGSFMAKARRPAVR